MRLLLIGDIHLADRPPSVRTETYADDILAKVRWCAEWANDHDINAVIALGDVFHVKSPSRTSHALVVRAAEAFTAYRGTTWIVPGNHDLSADRLDSLDSQPLGSLALSPRIQLANGYIPELDVTSFPYLDDLDEFLMGVQAVTDPDLPIVPPSLIVTHQSIFPPGDSPPFAHVNADQLFTHGVPVAYGHIHDPHGFYQAGGAWFCNNGAISRGSIHEETLKREPKVTVFDSEAEGCPFTSVDVPHKPASEVFRLAQVEAKQTKAEKLDDFLTSIGEVSLTSLSLEAILADAQTKLEPGEMTELRDIIEAIQ